ncbi:hypothetical protein CSPX01_09909 [Colletotrichum filicis]|nr:hypothetical protein CSPX01_09909 [Colletotrichum filicis]
MPCGLLKFPAQRRLVSSKLNQVPLILPSHWVYSPSQDKPSSSASLFRLTAHNILRRVRVKLVLPHSIVSDTLHFAMLLHQFLADDGSVLRPEQRVRGKANHLDAWRFRPRTRSPAPSPVRLWSGTEPPPARLDPVWFGRCRSEMSLTLPLVLVNKPDMLTSPNSVFSIFPILREASPPFLSLFELSFSLRPSSSNEVIVNVLSRLIYHRYVTFFPFSSSQLFRNSVILSHSTV